MQIHRTSSACVLALAVSMSTPALAQLPAASSPSPEDALSETARELFSKGVKASQRQKWDQCRAAFLAAFGIKKVAQIAGNLALCELKLGMYREAAEHISFLLQAQRPDAPAERRAAAEDVLREASAKIATVRLDVDVPGAEVQVDGRAAGTAPLSGPIFLDPGPHTIEARREGHPAARAAVDARAGQSLDLRLTLKEKATQPPERRPMWPIAVGAGATAVALGVGIGLTVAANGKSSDADAARAKVGGHSACVGAGASTTGCTALMSDLASRDSLTKGAFASFVVGGTFAVATAAVGVWAATTPKNQKDATAIRIVPSAGRDEGGIVVLGSF